MPWYDAFEENKQAWCLTFAAIVVARATIGVRSEPALHGTTAEHSATGDGAQPKCARCEHAKKQCIYETGRRFRRSSIQETFSESQPWVSMPPRSAVDESQLISHISDDLKQSNSWTSRMRFGRNTQTKHTTRFIVIMLRKASHHNRALL